MTDRTPPTSELSLLIKVTQSKTRVCIAWFCVTEINEILYTVLGPSVITLSRLSECDISDYWLYALEDVIRDARVVFTSTDERAFGS